MGASAVHRQQASFADLFLVNLMDTAMDTCGLHNPLRPGISRKLTDTISVIGLDKSGVISYCRGMGRRYEQTHPWLTFEYTPEHSDESLRLGEAFSKCSHLAGTPLQPNLAARLAAVYLVKGVAATTAIEGNSLREDEVAQIIEGKRTLPQSQQYLELEVKNVLTVLRGIDADALAHKQFQITPQWLSEQNRQILAGLEVADHVVPGQYTTNTLIVGTVYRGAPPEDIAYLTERLCNWINTRISNTRNTEMPREYRFINVVTTAILAHLYFVWIHPFGDGNGRTARALECAILATSGMIPWVSSNLLSDYYNRTRELYYRRLADASRKDDVRGFVKYALLGFVEMLREQIATVQQMQHEVAWVNYVHEQFNAEPEGSTSKRRRTLLLAMKHLEPTHRSEMRHLTAELAEMYAGKSDRTITRDVNSLKQMGLIEGDTKSGYIPCTSIIAAFLPANHHQ